MSEQPPDPPYGEAQDPYGQSGQAGAPNPYAQGAPPPYPGQGPYAVPQDHPQATTVLILGIVSLVLCQILGPFAWSMGNRVIREIDAAGGALGGRSTANAGRICGIISTVLLGLSLLLLVIVIIIAVAAGTSST